MTETRTQNSAGQLLTFVVAGDRYTFTVIGVAGQTLTLSKILQ